MYNRYIPDGASYTRIVEEDGVPFRPPDPSPRPEAAAPAPPLQEAEAAPPPEKKAGLSSLLKGLKLDDLDTGDILLLLILLFLFLEGDDIELIITLGLMLLLGLD